MIPEKKISKKERKNTYVNNNCDPNASVSRLIELRKKSIENLSSKSKLVDNDTLDLLKKGYQETDELYKENTLSKKLVKKKKQQVNNMKSHKRNQRKLSSSDIVKNQTEGIYINENELYFPKYLNTTVSPIYFNRFFTPLQFITNRRVEYEDDPKMPQVLTQEINKEPLNGFIFNERANGYVYNMPILLNNFTDSQTYLHDIVQNKMITDSTYEVKLSLASINANTFMITYIKIDTKLSSSGLFYKDYKINSFSLDPYKYSFDKKRQGFEVVFLLLFIWLLIDEFVLVVLKARRMKVVYKPLKIKLEYSKKKQRCYKFLNVLLFIKKYITKFILAVINYLTNIDTLLNFLGIIFTGMFLKEWTVFNWYVYKLRLIDFTYTEQIYRNPEYGEILNTIDIASESYNHYRNLCGVICGIHCLRINIMLFHLNSRLSYFFRSLMNSFHNNMYYMVTLALFN